MYLRYLGRVRPREQWHNQSFPICPGQTYMALHGWDLYSMIVSAELFPNPLITICGDDAEMLFQEEILPEILFQEEKVITPKTLSKTNEDYLIYSLKCEFLKSSLCHVYRPLWQCPHSGNLSAQTMETGSGASHWNCGELCGLLPAGKNLTTQPGHNLKQAWVFKCIGKMLL